jgi:hypothetical protein
MRCIPNQRRLLLHLDFRDHVVHWRVLMLLRHPTLVECGGLVCELMGRKSLGVLVLHSKGADVLEVMRSQSMRIEAMEMRSRRDLMYPAF